MAVWSAHPIADHGSKRDLVGFWMRQTGASLISLAPGEPIPAAAGNGGRVTARI